MLNKDSSLWLVRTQACSVPSLGTVHLVAPSSYLCDFEEFHISVFSHIVKGTPMQLAPIFWDLPYNIQFPQPSCAMISICLTQQGWHALLGFRSLHLRKASYFICWAPLTKRVIIKRWQIHRHSHSWCLLQHNPQHNPWTSRLGLGRCLPLEPGASRSSNNYFYVLVSKKIAAILVPGKDLRI